MGTTIVYYYDIQFITNQQFQFQQARQLGRLPVMMHSGKQPFGLEAGEEGLGKMLMWPVNNRGLIWFNDTYIYIYT